MNFLIGYSEGPLDLPSRHDDDRAPCTSKRRAYICALQLSLARAYHSGLVQTWHPEISFSPNTGEQIRKKDIFLSWIPVRRTEQPVPWGCLAKIIIFRSGLPHQ